jgi:chorismate dehydratase
VKKEADNISGPFRLGAVAYLNAQPLVAGLDRDPRVALSYAVPSELTACLDQGRVDVGLVPIVDVLRAADRWQAVSDACIACAGPTMTVRVFSQAPPAEVTTLYVDADSHTSVALARILWHECYGRELEVIAVPNALPQASTLPAVLLIGDKVMQVPSGQFVHETDLGELWHRHTGFGFVFAVWAAERDVAENPALAHLLTAARDRGVAAAAEIATQQAAARGWSPNLARTYLTECLQFQASGLIRAGAARFASACADLGIVPASAKVHWAADTQPIHESLS